MTSSWRGRAARALHRALLLLAPRDTRRRYRAEMIETFDALSRSADADGVRATARLVAREALDMLKAHRRDNPSIFPAERIVPMPAAGPSPRSLRGATHVWRALARRPVFAATVVLTLALGTGMTTALFAVVETVLIRPLPYPDADRLVTVLESNPTAPGQGTMAAWGRLEDWHRLSQTFAAISSSYSDSVTDTSVPDPERLAARRVTPRFFAVYGAPAVVGRTLTDAEELTGGPNAAVISDRFWLRRFARDPKAIGASLVISGASYPIVGVMGPLFASDTTDVWLPAKLAPAMLTLRDARFLWGVGRLKPGVTIDEARADLQRIQGSLGQTYPATDKGWSAVVTDLKEARIGDRGLALWLAFAAVALVWLISIANVAALVLADTYRRARELAIRSALGASRRRVAGVVVQEVLVMAIVGGAAGLLLANGILALVPRLFDTLPRLAELAIDWRAFGFAAVTSLGAGAVCGVVPALQATASGVSPVLARAGRGTTGGAHRLQRWLVGVQVALGVVLCSSATFLATSYNRLASVDRGFRPEGLVTFHVAARWDEDRPRIGQVQVDLVSALERQPGVTAAGFVSFLPAPGGNLRYQVTIDGLAVENGAAPIGARLVSAGYLRAIGVPLKAGQFCAPLRVDFNMPRTAMVNQAFIDRYAQGQNLVGRQVRLTDRPQNAITIVGVLGNIAEDGPRVAPFPFMYSCDSAGSWPDPNYVVRTADPASLIANLKTQVRQIDPSRAVFGVRILEDVLDGAVAEPRVNASVMGGFAFAALLVGAIGLYALFARLVAESRREIGVRLALGAAPSSIVGLVVADAGRLLLAGALAGLALSAGAFQFLRAALFNVGASDTAVVAAVTLVLLAAAGVAVVIPAVRASRVAPTEALRSEG